MLAGNAHSDSMQHSIVNTYSLNKVHILPWTLDPVLESSLIPCGLISSKDVAST